VPRINFQKSVIFAKKKYIFFPKMKKLFKYCFLKLFHIGYFLIKLIVMI